MKDEMKNFIQQNKQNFDSEKPSEGLWDRIEADLPGQGDEKVRRMVPIKRLWQMASGLTAVFVIAIFAMQYNSGEKVNGTAKNSVESPDQITNVEQLEQYYSVQVNDKINALKEYEVDDELLEEVGLLKDEFDVLKNEAGSGVNQEEILEFMIENYKLRLSILGDIMSEMKVKTEKVRGYEVH